MAVLSISLNIPDKQFDDVLAGVLAGKGDVVMRKGEDRHDAVARLVQDWLLQLYSSHKLSAAMAEAVKSVNEVDMSDLIKISIKEKQDDGAAAASVAG